MKVKDFLNTCDSYKSVEIRQIDEDAHISFDPDYDTRTISYICDFDKMADIAENILNATIELWTMSHDRIIMCVD